MSDRLSDVSFGLWTVKKDSFESAKRKKVATQEKRRSLDP
jgi:hypothetical protein